MESICCICHNSVNFNSYVLTEIDVKSISNFLKEDLGPENRQICNLCETHLETFKNCLNQLSLRFSLRKSSHSEQTQGILSDMKLHFLESNPSNHSTIKLTQSLDIPALDNFRHFICSKNDKILQLGVDKVIDLSSPEIELSYIILSNSQLSIWTRSTALSRNIGAQYHCMACTVDFSGLDLLIDHFMTHHSTQEVERLDKSCHVCEPSFSLNESKSNVSIESAKDALEYPDMKKSVEKKAFTCEFCTKNFTRKASLLEHIQRHKGIKDKECPVCHKMFYSTSFWRHMATVHPQSNKLSYKCLSCPKTFAQQYKLKIHEKIHLPYEERPFVCDKCSGKRFSTIHRLKSHIKNIHGNDSMDHLCPDCGLTFSSLPLMITHQKSSHDRVSGSSDQDINAKVIIQSPCGKELSRFVKGVTEMGSFEINNTESNSNDPKLQLGFSENPPDQIDFQDESKKFQCEYCHRMFKTEKARRSHLKNIHLKDKPFDCPSCNSKFSSLSYLKDHQRIHSDLKPYHCDLCQKTFRSNRDLNRHIRIHTGDKPYKCLDCNKCFGSPSNLSEHRSVHTGELPYSCKICSSKFRLWSSLNKHRIRHHSGASVNKENLKNTLEFPTKTA